MARILALFVSMDFALLRCASCFALNSLIFRLRALTSACSCWTAEKENTHREEILSAPTCCADLRSALDLEGGGGREREREREI